MERNSQSSQNRTTDKVGIDVGGDNDNSEDTENRGSASSILGSLERLVETSFRSSNNSNNNNNNLELVTRHMMAAKRAFGVAFNNTDMSVLNTMCPNSNAAAGKRTKVDEATDFDDDDIKEVIEEVKPMEGKKNTTLEDFVSVEDQENNKEDNEAARSSPAPGWQASNAELKFLKYSELAKELSGR